MRELRKARAAAWLLGATCCLLSASSAEAAGAALDANSTAGKKVSIDGWLKEWGNFTKLSHTIKGNPGGDRAAVGIAYDDKALYIAVTIKDSEIVRTSAMGANEDRVEVSLAVPKAGGGYASYDLWLFSGVPGKSAGAVKLRGGRAVAGAKLVEAATDGGIDIEASIPWSSLPATKQLRVGLHGAVRYVDYAGGKQKAIIATSDATGGFAMPPLRFENEQGLDKSLLSPKGLGPNPDKALYGNVTGDAQLEQVALYGGFLTILGAGYRGGKQFFYKDLSVKDASMVPSLELEDLTGDGRPEIIYRKRVGSSDNYREYLEVMSLSAKGEPFVLFEHETAIVTADGKIQNKVSLKTVGGKKAVVIADDVAEGWDQSSFREAQQGEMGGALLPWDGITERSFGWDGKQFKQLEEKKGKPRLTSAGSAPKSGATKGDGPPPPPAPRPPTADELQDQVYALYRKARNVGKQKPRFDFVTNVYGGSEMERVLVHGLDIVVFGTGYRGGTGFAYMTLPAKAPEDVVHVTAKDLTGDGKAEVLVRATLKTKTSEEFGGIVVERHALLVYEVGAESLTRIFGAETGRTLADKRVIGSVLFKPLKKGFELQLKAGRVVGWDKASYPFPVETTTAGGLEPLLLPWGSVTQLDYRYAGGAFKRQ